MRRDTHEEDASGLRAGGHEALARELERSWGDYERALERFAGAAGTCWGRSPRTPSGPPRRRTPCCRCWPPTPACALQVQTGVEAHRARFGAEGWRGGFWLPECAYAPWLTPALADAGVRATCVELTDRFGLGAREHLRPLVSEAGVMLVPIDRATISLVWSDDGYPAAGAYRDYHHHTVHHHNPWGNDGDAYDHARALALAREHAADFVARTPRACATRRRRSARRRAGGVRAGHRAARPLVV